MEGIIFIGIPASGKSTFYQKRFSKTHKIVSLDLVKSRTKEDILLNDLIAANEKIVIDNTNLTKAKREKYFALFKIANYKVIGYYFEPDPENCIKRNSKRKDKKRVPDFVITNMNNELETPRLNEGFHKLYSVKIRSKSYVVK